jgi:hypothetical protein
MGTYAIRARFEADCDAADLARWLDSAEGIAGWWSDTVTGEPSEAGRSFRVEFPTTDVPFELDVVEASGKVFAWHVPESPPWWAETTIRFDLSAGESGGTSLLFTHEGFEPDDPIIEVITPAWVRFLDNLVEVAESGQANPAVVN